MNSFFYAYQRGSLESRRHFCTNVKRVSVSSFIAPTLSSSAEALLLAFLASFQENYDTFIPTLKRHPPPNTPLHPSQTVLILLFSQFNPLQSPSAHRYATLPSTSHPAAVQKKSSPSPPLLRFRLLFFFTALSTSLFSSPFTSNCFSFLSTRFCSSHAQQRTSRSCSYPVHSQLRLRILFEYLPFNSSPYVLHRSLPSQLFKTLLESPFFGMLLQSISSLPVSITGPAFSSFSCFQYLSPVPGLSNDLANPPSSPSQSFHTERSTTCLSSSCHLFMQRPSLLFVTDKLANLFMSTLLTTLL